MDKVPQHLAVICDGNRTWARKRGLKVFMGHKQATKVIFEDLITHSIKKGIKYLTFWIFSTENWKRDKVEVDFLMDLFRKVFDERIDSWNDRGVRVKMIGDINGFADDIQEKIIKAEEKTKNNSKITVTLAMNYGGRDELTRAIKKMMRDGVKDNEVTPELVSKYLDTSYMPDPDLVVRTGEDNTRLSGFMLWQVEYSELVFPKFNFPDFTAKKLDEILDDYAKRHRRFGN